MGGGAGGGMGVSVRVGIEPAQTGLAAGVGPSRGLALGVPLFVLRRFFCLERPWNRSCELLPLSPALWVCHLILGSPDVSTESREESPGVGRCGAGSFQCRTGPREPSGFGYSQRHSGLPRGKRDRRKQGGIQRPELRAD